MWVSRCLLFVDDVYNMIKRHACWSQVCFFFFFFQVNVCRQSNLSVSKDVKSSYPVSSSSFCFDSGAKFFPPHIGQFYWNSREKKKELLQASPNQQPQIGQHHSTHFILSDLINNKYLCLWASWCFIDVVKLISSISLTLDLQTWHTVVWTPE